MKKFSVWSAAMILALFSFGAYAGDIQVESATVRATAPGQDSAMGDLHITSKQAAKLIGVSTPVAQTVEMHMMMHDNGMMMMHAVKDIELPAGKRVDLGESGYHLMLMGLKQAIKEGEKVDMLLTVRTADGREEKLKVAASVTPIAESEHDEHMHHH